MSSLEWDRVISEIMNCRKCPLYKNRKNPVPGEGPINTDIMIIGEAPGAKEDEEGRPFVGPAGKLLTSLLEKIGIKRSSVYITNIVKCRPPGNRDPTDEEIAACLPYLLKQIEIIKPKVIIALGRHAARTLFKQAGLHWRSMGSMHGKVFEGVISGVRVKIVATYHPAAALYHPKLKDVLERDFTDVIGRLINNIRSGFVEERERRQKTLLDFFTSK